MIPKILHYCWFGRKPLPDSAKVCIESWKRNCPDFEIKEWNEDNFDINSHEFVKQCYEAKKFGFIVDVLRAYILKEFGGIYLDTDVQIIKPLDESLFSLPAFLCYEDDNKPNVGLIGSEKHGLLINQIYKLYENKMFLNDDGTMNQSYTGPDGFKEILEQNNILLDGNMQIHDKYVSIYPKEYFCAKSHKTGYVEMSTNTYAIHHYDATWFSEERKRQFEKDQFLYRINASVQELEKLAKGREILYYFKEGIVFLLAKSAKIIFKKNKYNCSN
ncbi:glycosyl transferase [Elizabethkingia anophelis]|uniref:glycosyltransferase family 32 protein n=1 Tax=Elizabethkingia anophelis TaxID=1117645 RepID=UPI00099A66E1|nr:glycosyltransferase [Elizabethkingia anophelis]MDV3926654.1 glycosyl transferase [Elizabethkingia anophelis]MDV4025676.1 glycosyl transferase [Elizabethkingia anophelis]OPC55396.1 hypothetical protein BAY06_00470 [Elizabethkingia anophelis]